MSLTEIQQAWVYKKIDDAKSVRLFGINIRKPSDVCKELKLKTGDEIDVLMAKEKADAIAVEEAKIVNAEAELIKLRK